MIEIMKNLLVEVYLPSVNQSYDVMLPKKIYVYEAIKVISDMLSKLTDGNFIANDDAILCDKVTGKIISRNVLIDDVPLQNGSKLMLI